MKEVIMWKCNERNHSMLYLNESNQLSSYLTSKKMSKWKPEGEGEENVESWK